MLAVMAAFRSVGAVGLSLIRLLEAEFRFREPLANRPTSVVLIRTNDLALTENETLILPPAVSVLAYRVDFNKGMRPAWSATGHDEGRSYLPLEVHFLLTAWADNAEHELHIVGRALQAIDSRAVLAGPLLHPSGEWAENETVELVLEDIPTDDLMRIFDSLGVDYRLTVALTARVIVVSGLDDEGLGEVQTVVTGIRPWAAFRVGEPTLELLAALIVGTGRKVNDIGPRSPDRIALHAPPHGTRLPHGP